MRNKFVTKFICMLTCAYIYMYIETLFILCESTGHCMCISSIYACFALLEYLLLSFRNLDFLV